MNTVVVFLCGASFGTIIPAYVYLLAPSRLRKRWFARCVDAVLRVSAVYGTEATTTTAGRLRTFVPLVFRANLASGMAMFELSAGVMSTFARGGDPDGEVDQIRMAYLREQIEAALLDVRDEGTEGER